MTKINPIPKQVPVHQVPYLVAAADKEPQGFLPDDILDYKLIMNFDQIPQIEFGRDDEGYFVRAVEIYRVVK